MSSTITPRSPPQPLIARAMRLARSIGARFRACTRAALRNEFVIAVVVATLYAVWLAALINQTCGEWR